MKKFSLFVPFLFFSKELKRALSLSIHFKRKETVRFFLNFCSHWIEKVWMKVLNGLHTVAWMVIFFFNFMFLSHVILYLVVSCHVSKIEWMHLISKCIRAESLLRDYATTYNDMIIEQLSNNLAFCFQIDAIFRTLKKYWQRAVLVSGSTLNCKSNHNCSYEPSWNIFFRFIT